MPARSQAQRGFLYAKFGPAWAKEHHFDNKGPLPPHVKGVVRALKRKKKG
jgi:hypothetical protein